MVVQAQTLRHALDDHDRVVTVRACAVLRDIANTDVSMTKTQSVGGLSDVCLHEARLLAATINLSKLELDAINVQTMHVVSLSSCVWSFVPV